MELKNSLKKDLQRNSRLYRFFVLFFLLILIVFNWKDIYWLFQEKAIFGLLKQKINQNTSQTKNDQPLAPAESSAIANQVPENGKEIPGGAADSVLIPELNIKAPLVMTDRPINDDFVEALKNGVIHYPDSALPGENGTVIILGHSAPANWPDIEYQNVFSDISALKQGDEIIIYYQNREYRYRVAEGRIIDKGGDLPLSWLEEDGAKLVLLSCWPPGKNYKRYAVLSFIAFIDKN